MSDTPRLQSSAIRAVDDLFVDDVAIVGDTRRSVYEQYLKRPVDAVGAAVLLVLTAPLAAAVAIGVAISMGRPVMFRQTRVTKGAELALAPQPIMRVGIPSPAPVSEA